VLTKLLYNALHLGMMVFPVHMSCDYSGGSIPIIRGYSDARNLYILLAAATLLSLLGLALQWFRSRHPATAADGGLLLLALATVLIPLLPASHFLLDVAFVLAERLLYLPSAGVCLLLASLTWRVLKVGRLQAAASRRRRRRGYMGAMLLLVAVYSVKAVSWSWQWRSPPSLFAASLKTVPRNAKLHSNYAIMLGDDVEYAQTKLLHYRLAAALEPDNSRYARNLGALLQRLQRWSEALAVYHAGLAAGRSYMVDFTGKPSDQAAMSQFAGAILLACHQYQSALRLLRLATAIAPGDDTPADRLRKTAEAVITDNNARKQWQLDTENYYELCFAVNARTDLDWVSVTAALDVSG